ncbi:MAG: hypothetical protein Q8928_11550 [Bacteroidota bacterium]|nr:hypothetical protein [Bacteroidota bacterium]
MKQFFYITSLAAFLVTMLFTQCSSEGDNLPSYPTLQFVSGGKYYTSPADSVDVGDTVILKWNFASTSNMKYLVVEDKGATSTSLYYFKTMSSAVVTKTTITIPTAKRNLYSDTFAIKVISPGTATLRFTITDSLGEVISRTDVPINMKSDFTYWTRRILYAPDSVEAHGGARADAKSYLAAATGAIFSYNTIKANPNLLKLVDVGFNSYWITRTTGSTTTSTRYLAFYSLTNNMYPKNDLTVSGLGVAPSRITYVKRLISTTQANVRNALDIKTAVGSTLTSTKDSTSNGTTYPIGFKTAEGKYGIIWITYVSNDSIRIDMKVQK